MTLSNFFARKLKLLYQYAKQTAHQNEWHQRVEQWCKMQTYFFIFPQEKFSAISLLICCSSKTIVQHSNIDSTDQGPILKKNMQLVAVM